MANTTAPPDGHRFLTTKQAAAHVGLSPRTLEQYRVTGDGPPYVKHGGRGAGGIVLYEPADLEAWLNTRRRTSTCDKGGR